MVPKQTEDAYLQTLRSSNGEALWKVLHKMVPPRPNPAAAAATWRYEELRPALMEAGEIVSAEEAERRVIMLVNPQLEAPCTTDTIYAGLQLVLPGEIAPAHRHTAFALRFIIEGSNGFTAVEGQKISMERGDVILTPSWHWHDHGNEGGAPMIWLDGLDLPAFKFLRNNFAENYVDLRYPSKPVTHSSWKFPWRLVAESLTAVPGAHAIYHYHLEDGQYLSKTISAQAERIGADQSSPISQETVSFVYHVYEGSGYTNMTLPDGTATKINWKAKDTFSVPSWAAISHTNTSYSGDAFLFAITDRPMVESLGMNRKG